MWVKNKWSEDKNLQNKGCLSGIYEVSGSGEERDWSPSKHLPLGESKASEMAPKQDLNCLIWKNYLFIVRTASPRFTSAATQQRAHPSSHFSSQVCVCMCVHVYYISSSACCSRITVLGQKHKRWNISQCLKQLTSGFLHLFQSMWLFLCAPCSCISKKRLSWLRTTWQVGCGR